MGIKGRLGTVAGAWLSANREWDWRWGKEAGLVEKGRGTRG